MHNKIVTCLWFGGNAEDAATFYAQTFPNSRVDSINRAPSDYPNGSEGDVLTVEFTVCYHGPTTTVLVFAPNTTKPARTITKGVENFSGYPTMAVDGSGTIYVADGAAFSKLGSIVVYAPNQSKPRRVITTSIQHPYFLAIGR